MTSYVVLSFVLFHQEGGMTYPELVKKAKNGDKKALCSLLKDFEPMIENAARKYEDALSFRGDFDDLLQIGREGFIRAVESYDQGKSPAFIPYAREGVKIAIRDYLSKDTRLVRLPKSAVEKTRKLSDAYAYFRKCGNSEPTAEEIMLRTGFSPLVLRNTEKAATAENMISIDSAHSDGKPFSIPSSTGTEEEAVEDMMLKSLSEKIDNLSGIERFIIKSLYGAFGAEKLRTSEIAERLSLSETSIRRKALVIENKLCMMFS